MDGLLAQTHPIAPESTPFSDEGSLIMPSTDYILANWYTTGQAATICDLRRAVVSEYCVKGKFNARKIGGRWYVDPASVHSFQKTRAGQKRKDE